MEHNCTPLYYYRKGDQVAFYEENTGWTDAVVVDWGMERLIVKVGLGTVSYYKKVEDPTKICRRLVLRTVKVDFDTDPEWQQQERKFRETVG